MRTSRTQSEPAREPAEEQRRIESRIDCTASEVVRTAPPTVVAVVDRMLELAGQRRRFAHAASGARPQAGGDECARAGDRQVVDPGTDIESDSESDSEFEFDFRLRTSDFDATSAVSVVRQLPRQQASAGARLV
ncbi:hypothetical protein GCM10027564_09420 [Luteimonas notoginsengisoli]|uniref:Uncharacterized protein n=1 Tax=Luteimonas notoginsengisoli TaxID=1578200 RepID=A0ABV7UPS3_9GAMM